MVEFSAPLTAHTMAFHELRLIERIAKQAKTTTDPSVLVNIGDDCGVIRPSDGHNLLVTTDTLVENVHFDLAYFDPFSLGRKTTAVNLSDIAACGGTPRWAFLNLAVRTGLPDDFFELFLNGLFTELRGYGVHLTGGDTVSSHNELSITLTLLGETRPNLHLTRSTARSGDLIYCSGTLGDAACGLHWLINQKSRKNRLAMPKYLRFALKRAIKRHLTPIPRLALGRALAEKGLATACIDSSDGLATDIAHICTQSGVMAEIDTKAIPISRSSRLLCRTLGLSPVKMALTGGEDFELIWTTPPDKERDMLNTAAIILGYTPFRIGRIQEGKGVWLVSLSHGRQEISYQGFEHGSE
ncbi:MAG: thiamine-phosphate kinase [Dissulfuribacterales bacterium]